MTCRPSLLVPALLVGVSACSAGPGPTDGFGNNNGNGSGSGTGGSPTIITDSGVGVRDPNDPRNLPVRERVCDAAGNCTCLRLALLGTLESAAEDKDTTTFRDWLNGNSEGTATVTMVTAKPPVIDAAFLSQYDILVLANVNTWTFTPEERMAVETWVRETGGGIVALTGFISTAGEPAATSQLIEFSGVRYNAVTTAPSSGETTPVYYNGGTENLKQCLSWTMSEAHITTPIPFTPQAGSLEKLTFSLSYVGAFIGWGVDAPAGATVVATDPVSQQNMGVAYEVDGTGRIFAFGDEWVIFRNQWEPIGQPHNTQQDEYNPCWEMPANGEPGFYHSVATLYQTKQFWYNAINWVAPPNECNFTIADDDVIVY